MNPLALPRRITTVGGIFLILSALEFFGVFNGTFLSASYLQVTLLLFSAGAFAWFGAQQYSDNGSDVVGLGLYGIAIGTVMSLLIQSGFGINIRGITVPLELSIAFGEFDLLTTVEPWYLHVQRGIGVGFSIFVLQLLWDKIALKVAVVGLIGGVAYTFIPDITLLIEVFLPPNVMSVSSQWDWESAFFVVIGNGIAVFTTTLTFILSALVTYTQYQQTDT